MIDLRLRAIEVVSVKQPGETPAEILLRAFRKQLEEVGRCEKSPVADMYDDGTIVGRKAHGVLVTAPEA